MKKLNELKGTFGSKDIGELVDFVNKAPIKLPEDKRYHFEKDGKVVNVYCVDSGITQYTIDGKVNGVVTTSEGTEVRVAFGGVEKVVLHSVQYNPKPLVLYRSGSRPRSVLQGESKGPASSESRTASPRNFKENSGGESRRGSGDGESRR
ncbi:hypothetical protein HY837_03935 [archaeon]|nr:hypothetical protein [archaeon]